MKDRFADLQRAAPDVDLRPADEDASHLRGDGYFEEIPASFSNIFDDVEVIRKAITDIHRDVAETDRLHNKLLSSAQPEQADKQALEQVTTEVKRNANRTQAKLKRMKEELDSETSHSSADYRIKAAQHSSLTRSFISAMSEYNSIQNDYRDKCKDKIERQLRITGNEKSSDEIEDMLENGDPAVFTQGILMETAQAKQALNEINERHTAILNLEASIRELHSMFVDMAVLIQEQGEMINNIETNVMNTEEYTRQAVVKLREAQNLKSKTRCCCCLNCCKCTIL